MFRKFNFGNGFSRRAQSTQSNRGSRNRRAESPRRSTLSIERLEQRLTLTGNLDTSFDVDGWISGDFGLGSDLQINAVATQNNGKIVVAGSVFPGSFSTDMIVARFNADGSIDTTFGADGADADSLPDGYLHFDFPASPNDTSVANDIVIDENTGTITVVGNASVGGVSSIALARLTSSGLLDSSFGTGGKVQTILSKRVEGNALALLSDGRIAVAGTIFDSTYAGLTGRDFAVALYSSAGVLDGSFGSGGVATTDFNSSATLGHDDQAYDVAIQNVAGVDKIVVVGEAARVTSIVPDFALARYNLDGTLDGSFGTNGKQTQVMEGAVLTSNDKSTINSVAIDQAGRIVVVGTVGEPATQFPKSHLGIAVFTPNGVIDTSFNASGAVPGTRNVDFDLVDYGTSVVVQPDGKYLVGGYTRSGSAPLSSSYTVGLARLETNGSFDTTFGVGGIVENPVFGDATTDWARAQGLAITADGKIVVAGTVDFASPENPDLLIARYHSGFTLVNAAGPYVVDEGGSVMLTGVGGLVDADYTWDLDSDGVFGETGTSAANGDEVGPNPTFSAANLDGPSTETVTVRVNIAGLGLVDDSATVTVENVVPTLAISGASTVDEGSTYTLNLSSSDIAADTIVGWSVDWGDGSGIESLVGNPTSVTHTYADGSGSYTITATATDDDDTYAVPNSVVVAVNNVAPVIGISGASTTDEGALYTLNLSATDPGADTIASWTINWGDGSADETFVGNPASVTHTYADGSNNYSITATATDEDGTYSAGSAVALSVLNVAPTLVISGDASVDAGAVYTLNFSATDPGADTIAEWVIDWGDGSPLETFAGGTTSATHVFATGNVSRSISATATDEDGSHSSNTLVVNVVETVTDGVFLTGGVLNVLDSTSQNNIVSISSAGGTISVTLNGVTTNFNSADVDEIQIALSGGHDVVVGGPSITVPMTIDGGAGNDLIVGGAGDDLLFGGDGSDVLVGGAGDNTLLGGAGNDDLIGGPGNNVLVGGEGSDIAIGGLGRDLVIGSQDSDLLSGGTGEDILIGGHTIHDNDVDALDAIMAIWGSSSSFDDRINTLTGSGGLLEAGSAVFDDDALDIVIGGAGRDLIFGDTNPWDGAFDLIAMKASQDRLIAIS